MNGRDAEGHGVEYNENDKTKVKNKIKMKTEKDKDKIIVDERLKQNELSTIKKSNIKKQ